MVDNQDFARIQQQIDSENETKEKIRNSVRELERAIRLCTSILNKVHLAISIPNDDSRPLKRSRSDEVNAGAIMQVDHTNSTPTGLAITSSDEYQKAFEDMKAKLYALRAMVPPSSHYMYNDMWSRTIQNACFVVAFAHYLKTETLVTIDELGKQLEVSTKSGSDFHISIEEYLHGVISLNNELSRLAVNSVTQMNYDVPIRISKFVKELYGGFQLLNLKNDMLRKRFDGIKYDIKKIEEVVYDITLRGLVKLPNEQKG